MFPKILIGMSAYQPLFRLIIDYFYCSVEMAKPCWQNNGTVLHQLMQNIFMSWQICFIREKKIIIIDYYYYNE